MENNFTMPTPPRYPVGKTEGIFGAATAVLAVGLWNSMLYGGLNLGFALFSLGLLGCNVWYLGSKGHSFGGYEKALLAFAALIILGFARSSDSVVKAVMLMILLFAANLGFCLAAGQNRRRPGGFGTVLDAPRAFFSFGFGGMEPSLRGVNEARKNGGSVGKKGSAALLGIAIAVPVVAVMLPLLVSSDAAFEGLVNLLPETDVREPVWSVVTGLLAAWFLFARGLGLHNKAKREQAAGIQKRLSPITVNILLGAVGGLYLAYLLSQLAYFVGGLSGILPEGYTLAQYARRGFFEMAWLSGINLSLVLFCAGLVEREEKLPGLTRGLCLYLCAVTLFLIGTASAKMLLYIGGYGLTRLRVLTQTVMIWLAITTVLVGVRLMKPWFAYMQAVILTALALSILLFWVDVDSFVARYNVRAYQSGKLEAVDMYHLSELGYGALPYIVELTEDSDPEIAQHASSVLYDRSASVDDLRSWNYSQAKAAALPAGNPSWEVLPELGLELGLDLRQGQLVEYEDSHGGFHGDGETFAVVTFSEEGAWELETCLGYELPGWEKLPLTGDAHQVLYGGNSWRPLIHDDSGEPLVPELSNGWFFFLDRQVDYEEDYVKESIFSRSSFNFTLAVYDADSNTLYYFRLDT